MTRVYPNPHCPVTRRVAAKKAAKDAQKAALAARREARAGGGDRRRKLRSEGKDRKLDNFNPQLAKIASKAGKK